MSNFIYLGSYPETLADCRPVAPGAQVSLSAQELKEPHNKRLIDEGKLVELKQKPTRSKKALKEEGEKGE